ALASLAKATLCTAVGLGSVGAPSAAPLSFYVNGASTSCSDTGPGTLATPYCTITQAVIDRAGPGVILNVQPATYREQVTVSPSGASGSPFIIQASGGTVVVD